MAFNYIVTAHPPTNVSQSLTGNFLGTGQTALIISKCTFLEIYQLVDHSLKLVHSCPIYGRISCMRVVKPAGATQDMVYISTEGYQYCILSWDADKNSFATMQHGKIKDRIGRPAECGHLGIVDPQSKIIGMHLYDGLLKVIPVSLTAADKPFNVKLEELQILDMVFLQGVAAPTICLLYQDSRENCHLKTYTLSLKQKDFEDGPWAQTDVEEGASSLISVPAPFGGVVVLGTELVHYHNGSVSKILSLSQPNFMRTYCPVDDEGTRYLLGDQYGQMHLLALLPAEGAQEISYIKLEPMGKISQSMTMSVLSADGVVFVGSDHGDSQLVKLGEERDASGSCLTVLDTFTNLGPIVDFCVMDLDRQGQGQVVTCSGGYKDGSLRVVRSGIGINEQAAVDLPGIKGMWSLRETLASPFDKYLVQSFIDEIRVLAIEEDGLAEVEIDGFEDTATLFCSNVLGDYLVQVTSKAVRLVQCASLALVHSWPAPEATSITVASGNPSQVLVALTGGVLVYLEVEGAKLVQKAQRQLEYEISCVDLTPLASSVQDDEMTDIDVTSTSSLTRSPLCALGLWTDMSVRILRLPSLEPLSTTLLGGEVLPRSVLFACIESVDYLLVALGDGNLFTFTFDVRTGQVAEKKKVSLGSQQVLLTPFRSHGPVGDAADGAAGELPTHVFAASDRPAVVYGSSSKLHFSNVNMKDVNLMCPFHSEAFPDCLALATESELCIGTIDDIQKLHIRSVPLHEQPRRLTQHVSSRCLAVCTVLHEADEGGEEVEKNYVRLIDDQTFELLDSYTLEAFEQCMSVATASFAADSDTEYLVIGTAYAFAQEPEPTSGRILVFTVPAASEGVERKLTLVSAAKVRGAVYVLNAFNDKLLAGVNSKVELYEWKQCAGEEGANDAAFELVLECCHQGHILALYLQSRGDFIVVGDLMKSMSLLLYKSPTSGGESGLEQIARDYDANWMTAVEILDDDTFIGAENSYNLFTVCKNRDGTTDEERERLERVGAFHLGEFVNRIRPGSLVMRPADATAGSVALSPTWLFGTVNGAIGVIATLEEEVYKTLLRIQTQLAVAIRGVGNMKHSDWRSFKNEFKNNDPKAQPSSNFIDGDLIERFFDLDKEKMEEVVAAVNEDGSMTDEGQSLTVDGVIKLIEELQRLH